MGSTCASPLHAWAVLLEGMKWPRPCCLLLHWSSDWPSSGAAEMLWGAEVAAVLPAAGICSSTVLHYPVMSGSLCETRNKVSSQLPGVLAAQRHSQDALAAQGHSQDAFCSEQEPGRSFECRGIQEGLPSSFTTMLRVSVCLSSFLQRLVTQPSDRGPAVAWIQKLWPGATSSGSGVLKFSPCFAKSFPLSLFN